MSITPNPTGSTTGASTLGRTSLASSSQAKQVESEGGLLNQIQSSHKLRLKGWVLIGKIESFFTQRSIKKDYIKQLGNVFLAQVQKEGIPNENAELLFNNFIKPFLQKSSLKDIQHFETFIRTKNCIAYLFNLQSANPQGRKGIPLLKEALKSAIECVKKGNVVSLSKAFALLPQVLTSNMDGLQLQHSFAFLDAWVKNGAELESSQFTDFVNKYTQQVTDLKQGQGTLAGISNQYSKQMRRLDFFNTAIKTTYDQSTQGTHINALKLTFISQAQQEEIPQQEAEELFESHLKSFLQGCEPEEVKHFETFMRTEKCMQYLLNALRTFPAEAPELKETLESIIACVKNGNAPSLSKAFANLPKVARFIDRLKPEHTFTFSDAWVKIGGELEAEKFEPFLNDYTTHIDAIENTQADRPLIYDQGSLQQSTLRNQFMELYSAYPVQMKRLALLDLAMRDATVVENRQILQYSIASIYLSATNRGVRSVPVLNSRCSTATGDAPFGLYNQITIPFTLRSLPDDQILENFQASTNVFLTDPFTMETRSVCVPLPIQGKMRVAEAKKYLQLLEAVVNDHERFDRTYADLGFPEEGKEAIKQQFIAWDIHLGQEFGRALGDFNSTPTRLRETSAREKPEIAMSLKEPNSKSKAIAAAKTKNLFLLEDKTLSLIPNGVGEIQRDIGTISTQEMFFAKQLLKREDEDLSCAIRMPEEASDRAPIKTAELKIRTRIETLDDSAYLIMDTTIEKLVGNKTHTRTTYYELENKTPEQVKDAIVKSKLFERDLLLAKAEFMEKHVK